VSKVWKFERSQWYDGEKLHADKNPFKGEWRRDGVLGGNCLIGGAHEVEQHYNYNGGGSDAFGGADQWPVISARVAFPAGDEVRAAAFAAKLRAFIDQEIG
jgi:hypothetical protein